MEFGRDRCENVFRNPICNASLAFADGQEARLITSQDERCSTYILISQNIICLNSGLEITNGQVRQLLARGDSHSLAEVCSFETCPFAY